MDLGSIQVAISKFEADSPHLMPILMTIDSIKCIHLR